MNIVVVGSLGFDYIMNYSGNFTDRIMEDKIHSLSLSFLVETLAKQFGGTAGNIAYTLKLLGIEPYILACAGNDFTAYKQFLKKNKVSTNGIREYDDVSTSSYFVVTDTANNQIGSFYIGAMKYASQQSLNDIKKKIDYVIIAPTDPKTMTKIVKECQEKKIRYLYDPAFQIATFSEEELLNGISGCDILIGNDYEIHMIEDKLSLAHDELIAKVPILITTLGNKGSIIETLKESIHIKPAKPTKNLDPTGAGDTYRAGFMAGYLRNIPLDICGMMGSVASAYTVEKYGTQTHTFTKKMFTDRFFKNFNYQLNI